MVVTRSMSAAKETGSTASKGIESNAAEKPMEEAFQEFLKTALFKRTYPDSNTRQQMSYPFEPPEEFKKFEERGRWEWRSYSELEREYYVKQIQRKEARKRVSSKWKSGEDLDLYLNLTDNKYEKSMLEDVDEAGLFSFTCRMSTEFWKGKEKPGEKKIQKEERKIQGDAIKKWNVMNFKEKSHYFNPKWFE